MKFDIAAGDNFNSATELTATEWKFTITPADQSAPTGLGVQAPTTADGNGKITGTTANMQYNTSADATSGWNDCTDSNTDVAPGTYYVRYKADANHNASPASTALTVPAYTAETYAITVTDGTASPDGNQRAGTTITITATVKTDMVFDKWVVTSGTITLENENSATTKFTMPASAVTIKATYKNVLGGTVNIDGTAKYNETLTANTSAITGKTGTLSYQWKRNGSDISGATNSTYKLVQDDIGKSITVSVTSSADSGTITSAGVTIAKADGPAAPAGLSGVACTTSANNNGKITGVTTAMEYSSSAEFTSKTTCTGTEITGLTNGTYYVRVAATETHNAGAHTAVTVAAYTAPSVPGGGGGGGFPVIPVETPAEKFVKDNMSANGAVIKTVDKNNYEQILVAADKYDKLSASDKAAVDKLLKEKAGMDMATFTAEASKVKASIAEPSSNTDKVKSLVKGLSIKASSAKLKSKSIRVTLSGGTSSLAEIKKLGYTVKYKFYRSTKKTSSYKAMITKNAAKYVNSTGKKGTMYYYKARVMVYDKAGKLVAQSELKQCKYANRKWTK